MTFLNVRLSWAVLNVNHGFTQYFLWLFTARCYADRGFATPSRLSDRLSVTLILSWSHRLEIFKKYFHIQLAWGVRSLHIPTSRIYSKGNTLKPPLPWKWGSKMHPLWYVENGHISATGDTIHFKFRSSRVFRVAGSNGAISGSIKFKMATGRHLGKFQRHCAVSVR